MYLVVLDTTSLDIEEVSLIYVGSPSQVSNKRKIADELCCVNTLLLYFVASQDPSTFDDIIFTKTFLIKRVNMTVF